MKKLRLVVAFLCSPEKLVKQSPCDRKKFVFLFLIIAVSTAFLSGALFFFQDLVVGSSNTDTASDISDKIGHIMNYGDGWYGGVFIGAMYTQAFILNDVNRIVSEALKTIPEKSTFYQSIADVVRWHKQYPSDWHRPGLSTAELS